MRHWTAKPDREFCYLRFGAIDFFKRLLDRRTGPIARTILLPRAAGSSPKGIPVASLCSLKANSMSRQSGCPLPGFVAGRRLCRQVAVRRLQRLSRFCEGKGRFDPLWLRDPCPAWIFRGERTSAASGRLDVETDRVFVSVGGSVAPKPGRASRAAGQTQLTSPAGGGAAPPCPE